MGTERSAGGLSWLAIVRLGLVQTSLGSVVVLTTSTLNRVMIVELALAAAIPGALVGLHYAVQLLRPLWGHNSDRGGRRTVWILGGVALLAVSGTAASASVLAFERSVLIGLAVAVPAYVGIGFGIGAAGTSLLALLASRAAPARRPAAATIVWLMMIAGIVLTAGVTGALIDPYTPLRLVAVTAGVGAVAFIVTALAVRGVERRAAAMSDRRTEPPPPPRFVTALKETWRDPAARLFTIFVFVSMLAYSAQDLVLEPFGGLLFGMTPGETTRLGGIQHAGVFVGMVMVGLVGSLLARRKPAVLKTFVVGGCILSGVALTLLALAAAVAPAWPLTLNVMLLGFANGAFAVAAIGSMMALAGSGGPRREGVRMGLWGAAQACAFGLGGFLGAASLDAIRATTGDTPFAFAVIFGVEAALFLIAAAIATRIGVRAPATPDLAIPRPTVHPAE